MRRKAAFAGFCRFAGCKLYASVRFLPYRVEETLRWGNLPDGFPAGQSWTSSLRTAGGDQLIASENPH